MYRLLFTTKDNLHQLTVITDGIDSQLNVFVTENTVGDVDYFESLGIVIRAGLTYNIGQFKEWAMNNILRLIAYPEEYEGKEQILVDIVEEMRYFLIAQDKTMAFPKEGDSIEAVVTSYKQLSVYIMLIVAPTETVSKKIWFPTNSSAEVLIIPCSILTVAPSARNPFK